MQRLPAFLLAARILATLGMAFTLAIGIFLVLAERYVTGLAVLAAFPPFFLLLWFAEGPQPRGQE